jgi:hypothetical protein
MKRIALFLFVVLLNISFVFASCPYNSGSLSYCLCDDGQKEVHTSITSLTQARKDPESCCYFEVKKVVDTQYLIKKTSVITESINESIKIQETPKIEIKTKLEINLSHYIAQYLTYLRKNDINLKQITLFTHNF